MFKSINVTCILFLFAFIFSSCNLFTKVKEPDEKIDSTESTNDTALDEINSKSMKQLSLAIQYKSDGRYKKALEVLWEISPASSVFSTACLEFIKIGALLNDDETTLFGAKRYVQIHPTDTKILFIYAKILINQPSGFEKAEKITKQLIELKPDNEVYEFLAKVQILSNNFSDAEQTIQQILKNLENDEIKPSTSLLILQTRALIGQKAITQALSILDEIVAESPDNKDALLLYLSILKNQARYIEIVNKYLEKNPDDLEIIEVTAEFLFESGDYMTSSAFYEKALVIKADDLDLSRKIAECWMILGEYEKAILVFQNILKYIPNDENVLRSRDAALRGLVQYLKDNQEWAKAEKYLQIYSWNKPEEVSIYQDIAYLQEKQGQLIKARITHQIIIDTVKANKKSLREIVRLSLLLNDTDSAFYNLQKLIQQDPNREDIIQFVHLGINYKYYKEAYNACRMIYLDIFKDKDLYELYREVIFRLLMGSELQNILDDSLAEWRDSNSDFKKKAILICLRELENLENFSFAITTDMLRNSIFVPETLKAYNFSAKNKPTFVTQTKSEKGKVDGADKPLKNDTEMYSSTEIEAGLKYGFQLIQTLKILSCDIDKLSLWNAVLIVNQTMLNTKFDGSVEELQPGLALFPDAFKYNILEKSQKKLHKLRANLLLKAHEKNKVLAKLNFARMLVSDLSQTDIDIDLALKTAIGLTDAAEISPELCLDALDFAKKAELYGGSEKFKLPAYWELSTATYIEFRRLSAICYDRLLKTSLHSSFMPDIYVYFLEIALSLVETQEIQKFTQQVNNLLYLEMRKPARAILFEIIATCKTKLGDFLAGSTFLQYGLLELELLSTKNLGSEQLKLLNERKFSILNNIGDLLVKLKNPDAAVLIYKRILAENPKQKNAYHLIVKSLLDSVTKTELPMYRYLYLVNITDADDYRKWWADFERDVNLFVFFKAVQNKDFESIKTELIEKKSLYPKAHIFSFMYADLLAFEGETLKSADEKKAVLNAMEEIGSIGLILPALKYLAFAQKYKTLESALSICSNICDELPDYHILKARIDFENEEFEIGETELETAEDLLIKYQDTEYFDILYANIQLEKTRFYIKSASTESAMAFLVSLDSELRIQLKDGIFSQSDFESLWYSSSIYQLLRCPKPTEFVAELYNGRFVKGFVYYQDDSKIHLKLPDGTFSIIQKNEIMK